MPTAIMLNPFMPTVPTFAVRETLVSRTANVGTWLRKRNGGQKWVKAARETSASRLHGDRETSGKLL